MTGHNGDSVVAKLFACFHQGRTVINSPGLCTSAAVPFRGLQRRNGTCKFFVNTGSKYCPVMVHVRTVWYLLKNFPGTGIFAEHYHILNFRCGAGDGHITGTTSFSTFHVNDKISVRVLAKAVSGQCVQLVSAQACTAAEIHELPMILFRKMSIPLCFAP